MRILITGANGRLGSSLVPLLQAAGHDVIPAIYSETTVDFDMADFRSTRAYVEAARPQLVIHPAAWTDVDGCARDPERAIRVNGLGTHNVALAAARVGAAIAYISSNEVFDGKTSAPYREYDPTRPINPYGYSKWVGEQAIQHINPQHYIIRTAWLFAHGGKNFIQSILNAANAGKPIRVVTDEIANPTYNEDLAQAVAALVLSERYGVYHLTNEGYCSRWTFARYALDHAGFADLQIDKITAREWNRPSVPPAFSPLANTAAAMIGVRLRNWQAAVDTFLKREGLWVK